jgi:YHS domain-containing protein
MKRSETNGGSSMKILGIQIGKKPVTAVDPVCKMSVDINNPPGGKADFDGRAFYFCSTNCRETFAREPQKYVESVRTA